MADLYHELVSRDTWMNRARNLAGAGSLYGAMTYLADRGVDAAVAARGSLEGLVDGVSGFVGDLPHTVPTFFSTNVPAFWNTTVVPAAAELTKGFANPATAPYAAIGLGVTVAALGGLGYAYAKSANFRRGINNVGKLVGGFAYGLWSTGRALVGTAVQDIPGYVLDTAAIPVYLAIDGITALGNTYNASPYSGQLPSAANSRAARAAGGPGFWSRFRDNAGTDLRNYTSRQGARTARFADRWQTAGRNVKRYVNRAFP